MQRLVFGLLTLLALAGNVRAGLSVEDARKLFDRASRSLVVVQYTLDSESGRRELFGQGIVVGEGGLVMVSMAIVPNSVPDEQMKDFRIILPGDDEKEFDAQFLGRDDRTELAFVKAKQPQNWPAITFEDVPLQISEMVYSVGLLPRDAGYKPYYTEAMINTPLRGPIPYYMVSPAGLATVGSPVFNADGKAVGYVAYQQGQNPWLNRNPRADMSALAAPTRFFVPASDFLLSLRSPPNGQEPKLPWLGAALTGLAKPVAEYYGLKNVPVAQIGEVIPQGPAEKAGLRTGDKILKLNGKPLERGDEPEEAAAILNRKLRRFDAAQRITLSVQRERGKPPADVSVVLEEQPRQPHTARRHFAEDLGMTMREVVFADTYLKKVPADTPGVVVSYVRQASSAATAGLKLGDLVTLINKQPIQGLDDFVKQYKSFRERNPKDLVVLVVIREQRTEVIKIEPPQ